MRHTIKNGRITRRSFLIHSTVASLSLALGGRFASAQAAKPKWNAAMELAVTFTTVDSGTGRYQRPYVAVWIEDAAGTPVRTLSIWMLSPPRGTRYLDELRRWYGEATDNPVLTNGTTSSPTRPAGTYTVTWDGKTDKGALVNQGDYYVCVESVREHGPYSLVRGKVTLASAPLTHKLPDDSELKGVSVELRKHA
ncbi:DUF2271 domain-containing protein [Deinococcus sonorensis]|uniref:DUF2271 domain-containing protein n=2 Tax=Deinococcus sonorensis TaxID=309891 RepID=A0AAU7UCL8_9DEIO